MTSTATAPSTAPDVTNIPATMKAEVEDDQELSLSAKALALILISEGFDQQTWGERCTAAMLRVVVAIIRAVDTEDDLSYEDAAKKVLRDHNPFALEMIREGLWAVNDRSERARHIQKLAAHTAKGDRINYLAGYIAEFITSRKMDEDEFDAEADELREGRQSA